MQQYITPLTLLPFILTASLQLSVTVTRNEAVANLPNTIDFTLEASSDTEITAAEIEVHTDALACGQSATSADPDDFTAGEEITAAWTWDLRETGSLPPGTTLSWRWILHTADGGEFATEEESLTLTDDSKNWREIETESLILYWYEGEDEFARTLIEAGQTALDGLEADLGIQGDEQIRVYTYNSSEAMQNSTLYAPAWSGGLAFSDHNALLIAVSVYELEWGQRIMAHELTHIAVGRHTFSCVNTMPIWFNEGLAMVREGEMEPYYQNQLDEAVRTNELLSVKELGYIFSGQPELATLSYGQSMSLVTYLVEEHGYDKLLLLMDEYQQGHSEDRALEAVYGFDRVGLEVVWRDWIGADPMEPEPERAEPTIFPTLPPIGAPPEADERPRPTPDFITTDESGTVGTATATTPALLYGIGGIVIFGLLCVVPLVLIGIGVAAYRRQRKPPTPAATESHPQEGESDDPIL